MSHRHSIFRRYLLYFGAVVSVAILATGVAHLLIQYQGQRAAIDQTLGENAAEAHNAIQGFLDRLVRDIRHHVRWTRWPFHPGGLEVTRLEFILLLRQAPAITDLMLLDANGKERLLVSRLAMDRIDSGRDWSSRAAFQQTAKQTTGSIDTAWFGSVYYRKQTEPYIDIALRSGDGDDATVTVASVNLRFLWDHLTEKPGRTSVYAYVVDREGRLIAHPDLPKVLSGTRADRLGQVRRAMHRGDTHSPQTEAVEGYDFNGREVFSAAARVRGPDWLVFAEQTRATALSTVGTALSRTALLLLLGLALALIAGFLLARHMTSPIKTLQEGVEAFSRGDLDHRIHLTTGDELETLAEACNHMAQQIRSSHRDLEQKVRERTRALDAASRHKSEFLANMSHELRTPLNGIMGFSEALEMRLFGELTAKQAEYVRDIRQSGQHLLQLINDILDLSKVEAGQMELELIALDVDKALRAAAKLVRATATKRGIDLTLEFEPGLPLVHADERKLKQVVINLLSNALKFTPRGGKVLLQARQTDSGVTIACRDTGIGIDEADQARVFDEFQQVCNRDPKRPEGTGLGLALTRRLVEMHGGTITVESCPGQGSVFSFTLPDTA